MTDVTKNSYFKPILIGIIIAVIGIIGGIFLSNKAGPVQKGTTIITELEEKGEFASILFGKKRYDLSYNQLPADSMEVLSNFEPGDDWQGDGFWDKRISIEGKSSLALNSTDHQTAKIFYVFPEAKDFSKVKFIEFYLNLSDSQLLESANIKIGNKDLSSYYIYNLSNLINNWNVMQIPVDQMVKISQDAIFDLSKIEKLQFELLSRPQQSVVANLDYLSIIRNDSFLKDWQTHEEKFVGLGKFNDQVVLAGKNTGTYQATLSEVPGLKDFVYEAKVSPQTDSSSGLFFRGSYKSARGYYFHIGGKNTNTWMLRKSGSEGWEELIKGEISNFAFDDEKFYWLRVITNGNAISLYFSLDGKDFTQLAEVTDDEFASGGVGIAVFGGYSYFDDFKVKK